MNNHERYKKFESSKNLWKPHFVWQGIYGDEIYSQISINAFAAATGMLKNCKFKDIYSFYRSIKNLSLKYIEWCKSIIPFSVFQIEETKLKEELSNFFTGALGEYFFVKLFEYKKTLLIRNNSNTYALYTFYNVCPRLEGEIDFGVDFTGQVFSRNTDKNYDCVMQVKFWCPYSKKSVINKNIIASAYAEADKLNFIDKNDNANIFICWLGDMKNVTRYFKLLPYKDNVVFIDINTLKDNTVKDEIFWTKISEDISNIQ